MSTCKDAREMLATELISEPLMFKVNHFHAILCLLQFEISIVESEKELFIHKSCSGFIVWHNQTTDKNYRLHWKNCLVHEKFLVPPEKRRPMFEVTKEMKHKQLWLRH